MDSDQSSFWDQGFAAAWVIEDDYDDFNDDRDDDDVDDDMKMMMMIVAFSYLAAIIRNDLWNVISSRCSL